MTSRPLVLAHRGACRRAPENTLEAFRIARELGADGVELDARRTADGVLVVSHDPVVSGLGLLVEHPFAQVREQVPSVPTLEEALDALTGMIVNIEIKGFPTEPDADPERIVARGVVALVAQRAIYESVIVSSFELNAVDTVHELDPGIATAWLTSGLPPASALPIVETRGHTWLHPDVATLRPVLTETVRDAAARGVRLDTWTVDDADDITALAAAGIDAIITNLPDLALEILR